MKLFNKTIDRQLFKQYSLGSDLSKQEVVVKIFNPYGRGTWYILNSDPSDPDYLWAIVDLGYGAEVGSVSRSELENYRNKMGWGFERDLSFDPTNAEELYKGVRQGKFYANGGDMEQNNTGLNSLGEKIKDDKGLFYWKSNIDGKIRLTSGNGTVYFLEFDSLPEAEAYVKKVNAQTPNFFSSTYAKGGEIKGNEVTLSKGSGYYDLSKYSYGNDFKRFLEPTKGNFIKGTIKVGGEIRVLLNDGREIITDKQAIDLPTYEEKDELYQQNKHLFSFGFADGGDFQNLSDNQLMVINQNIELEHHQEELERILEEKIEIPAWVVAKMAVASENVSDIAHYLDGESELKEDKESVKSSEFFPVEDEDDNENENKEDVSSSEFYPVKEGNNETQEELKDTEIVEPINVSAGTKAELTKKFTDDAMGNLKGFLKGMEGIDLRDDYTFDYKGEQFEVEPIINSDENGVSNAVFSIFDGDGEEVGEVAYSREGGKQKFTANSDYFQWNDAKFEDGGYFDGTIPNVSTYMTNFAKGGEIAKAEILGLSRNVMGTTDIEMKITGMRKPQDFIVYPIGKDDAGNVITIQSNTRIGQINLVNGVGVMSQSHSSGAYFVHLQMDKLNSFTISESDLEDIKAQIFRTAGANVGTRGIVSDNSGASGVYADGGGLYKLLQYALLEENGNEEYIDNLPKYPEVLTVAFNKNGGHKIYKVYETTLNNGKFVKYPTYRIGRDMKPYSKLKYVLKALDKKVYDENFDVENNYAKGGSLSEKEQILEALENYDSDDNEFEEDQQFFVTDDLLGFIRGLKVSDKESIVEALSDYDGDDFVVTSPLLSFVENINVIDNYAKGGEIAKAEILGLSRNIMGTTDIEMKISGMRKPQEFIVYPIGKDDAGSVITVQSDTRIGKIDLSTGRGVMSQSHSNGAYFVHLQMDKLTPFTVSESNLEDIKAHIFKTAGSSVGTRAITSDNSGASRVYANGGNILDIGKSGYRNVTKEEDNALSWYNSLSMNQQKEVEKHLENYKIDINDSKWKGLGNKDFRSKYWKDKLIHVWKSEGSPEPQENKTFATGGKVDNQFNYMLLGRLASDCDYYLGNGNRHDKHLWAGNVDAQIKEMKRLWNGFPKDAKPEWLSMDDILTYEKKMKNQYYDGGDFENYDGIASAKTKGRESIDWNQELREYAGDEYINLTEKEKEEIISDLKRDWDRSNSYADGGLVDGFNLVFEKWSKMMGGNGVGGSIRTTPENYYVATIDNNGDILFEDLEANTRNINKNSVKKLWEQNRIKDVTPKKYYDSRDDYSYEDGGFMNNVYAKGGGVQKSRVYIKFLNKDKNFREDTKYFDSYEEAVKWGRDNFERFDQDMIHYSEEKVTEKKYILKADIKTVTVKRNGKEVTYKGADVLNGANVLSQGGDITSKANYVPKRDVISVELKNGTTIKPVNGYWVKKDAEPITSNQEYTWKDLPKDGSEINITAPKMSGAPDIDLVLKYDSKNFRFDIYVDGVKKDSIGEKEVLNNLNSGIYLFSNKTQSTATSAKENLEIGETYIKKDARGNWRAETNIDNFNGYDWRISTVKTYSGNLISSAQGGKAEDSGTKGITMFKYTIHQDPNHTLEVSKPKRLTDKVVSEQHEKALVKFKKYMETGMFKGGGKISNFDKLSARVAKEYKGQPVKGKYQEEYGKYYSQEEAQEVGNKVAGKLRAMQTDKKAFGGLFGKVHEVVSHAPQFPDLEGKQVRLKSGEIVDVFSQSGSDLSVLELGKVGTGLRPHAIDISEVDMNSFKLGGTIQAKIKNGGTEMLKKANELAKQIRKDGESWFSAKKRAFAQLKK